MEELLQDYEGTVFLVSHDRAFMDNVVTSIIACEATEDNPGFWREYEGSVQDWLTQSKRSQAIQAQNKAAELKQAPAQMKTAPAGTPVPAAPQATPKTNVKRSYKEQRELDNLPTLIASLEAEQAQLRKALEDGSLFVKDPAQASSMLARDGVIETELLQALERWEALSVS